jgi:chromate transporter
MELAGVFLRLGTTAFGGPAAHIAMMEQEFVRRRGWLTREEFLDLLGAVNLIPGPNSTEMAIFIGYRQAGWMGWLLAGCCFILPAMVLVGALAWVYLKFGSLPQTAGILYGVEPVIIAIIVQALWGLGRAAMKTTLLAVIAVAAVAFDFLGVNVLAILFGCGVLTALIHAGQRLRKDKLACLVPMLGGLSGLPLLTVAGASAASPVLPFSLLTLFLVFLRIGAVLFGSGYVLLAFLRTDLVEHRHWLTESQLLDAVAVGQMTPGPVFTTATFIGYLLGGPWAALVATVGIFLPAFVLVAISRPLIPRLRASPVAGAFLDGVNVASLALMTVVAWQLGHAAIRDWLTAVLALASAALLLRFRLNSAWLVLGGAAVGWLASVAGGKG